MSNESQMPATEMPVTEPSEAVVTPSRARRIALPAVFGLLAAAIGVACYLVFVTPFRASTVDAAAAGPIVPVGLNRANITFTASGASFPYPLYSKMFDEYHKLRPGVRINYSSVGSGAGIRQVSDGATDFGASDAPMTDAQLKEAKHGQLLHIPMTLGAVVPIYNLPGVDEPLVFSGPVLADLFSGRITHWNDPQLAALNPGVSLPGVEVTIVHRADGSGTTYVFTDYLSKVSDAFHRSPGKGTVVDWPAPNKVGGKGSESVAGIVAKTPGTVGYVELTYALQNRIAFGAVVNAAGKPIRASLESVTEAAANQTKPPADLRMSITNAPGPLSYPIAAFSYLLVYRNQPDPAKADALADFLTWAVIDGQRLAPALGYAPLPAEIVARNQGIILSLTVNGHPFAAAR